MSVTKKIKRAAFCGALALTAGCGGGEEDGGTAATATLTLYTSIRETIVTELLAGYTAKHPGVTVTPVIAGAGNLMSRIETERAGGGVAADIIWTSEVPDFYYMKDEGLLLQYRPAGADAVLNPLDGTDNYFIPARLGTLGIAYNTGLAAAAPASWQDLAGPDYADGFAIADPAVSGTSFVSVAMLTEAFGEEFFRSLRANGASVGAGSSQVVDSVASGGLKACLAVDYMVFERAGAGAPIAMAYPQELIVIPSPAAIFKGSPNTEHAKKFIDYLITPEAQQIIANSGTLPVIDGVSVPVKYNIPSAAEAMSRDIEVDYIELITRRDELIETFLAIMGGD